MNGAHDLGGAHGFGPVRPEPDEPVFHAEWERRVFALTLAMGATGTWTLDASRFARERLDPSRYLAMTYYERWLAGLEAQLKDHGLVEPRVGPPDEKPRVGPPDEKLETAAGVALQPAAPIGRVLAAASVAAALARGSPTDRDPGRPARFASGQRVRARNLEPQTHSRLPAYVRGRLGTVVLVHGCHVFPDSNAHGRGEDPQWLYTVRFGARELWGPDGDPAVAVSVDAFEPYLEPAP